MNASDHERGRAMNALMVGLLGAIVALLVAHDRVTPYDNYVLFADALRHGQLYLRESPGLSIDAVLFEGKRYIVNDPVPGVLILPLVALVGTRQRDAAGVPAVRRRAGRGVGAARAPGCERARLGLADGLLPARHRLAVVLDAGRCVVRRPDIVCRVHAAGAGRGFGRKRGWLVALWSRSPSVRASRDAGAAALLWLSGRLSPARSPPARADRRSPRWSRRPALGRHDRLVARPGRRHTLFFHQDPAGPDQLAVPAGHFRYDSGRIFVQPPSSGRVPPYAGADSRSARSL